MRVSTESVPWRRKCSCHSCWELNLQPSSRESGALPLSCPHSLVFLCWTPKLHPALGEKAACTTVSSHLHAPPWNYICSVTHHPGSFFLATSGMWVSVSIVFVVFIVLDINQKCWFVCLLVVSIILFLHFLVKHTHKHKHTHRGHFLLQTIAHNTSSIFCSFFICIG